CSRKLVFTDIRQDILHSPTVTRSIKEMKRLQQLDGLRGVAVLMVVFSHLPFIDGVELFNLALFVAKKSGLGYIGVEIFFILSGYLITRILIKDIASNEQNIISQFYIKRVFRLAP